MPEMDFLGPEKKVTKELTYNHEEFYNYLKSWFGDRHYAVVEKDYSERVSATGKRVYNFNWWIEKRIEPLTKIVMELQYNAETEETQVKLEDGSVQQAQKGPVTIGIRAFIYRDSERDWRLRDKMPQVRLIRDILDKTMKRPRMLKYEEQLKNDMNLVFSDIKTYLKTHKYD
ncbi:MAG: hypothetical protein Q8Q35_04565 [Nanoarchaeota archaeon]|nr:hypothetical protein [Nanoarchaeota archaeon]